VYRSVIVMHRITSFNTDHLSGLDMFLFKKFISFTAATLKRFIFTATLIVSAVTFAVVITIVSFLFLKQAHDTKRHESTLMARHIMEAITEVMERGGTLAEIEHTLDNYRRLFPRQTITIQTANNASATRHSDESSIARVMQTGNPVHHHTPSTSLNIFPVKAETSCRACHQTFKPGQVQAILIFKEDISQATFTLLNRAFSSFLLLLPFPLLMAFLVARFVNHHLGDAVSKLNRKVHSVTTVSDLTQLGQQLELEGETLKFGELEDIFGEFSGLVTRIRDVAVGREMLEFEIKVLERFIITSEAIRDWKERVGYLLNEVNKVMPAYALFCVFQVEEEGYDIEIFWSAPPTATTRSTMESIIRQQIRHEKLHCSSESAIMIIHNITNDSAPLLELAHDEIELETKSLYLDMPQIGGVVGIGVQSQIMSDPIRSLVINSILTTLLNVIGSIKAIYKYTKDLEYYATRDPLTTLFNQRVFWELLGYEIGRAERHNQQFGVLVIDLDNFKHVNDTYGHLVGDTYLVKIADTIHDCLRSGDILARYGGDEFAIVLPEADAEQVHMVADRIREAMEALTLVTADGSKIRGTASIGYAICPDHATTAKDLFLFADNMTYKAKSQGKNCIVVPTNDDVVEIFQKSSDMSRLLLNALEEKLVVPYFQPIVTCDGQEVICNEVLCRVIVGDQVIPASEFIELAEKLGVVSRLDAILMEKVFAHAKAEEYDGYLFINLSPKSLILKEFVPSVIRLSNQYQIAHDKVVFEITERETVRNMTLLEQFVQDLKLEGFKFAIDDFGSGFSSFQYIRRLPIDFVKIEGMFVLNMLKDPKDMAFVKTLAVLAREFGIKTIAEYIESEELLHAVRDLGIDLAQGYYTGRPEANIKKSVYCRLGQDAAHV
jgi:diguanylate cyclase (GGDEF)-like protein